MENITIWKFPITANGESMQGIAMPEGAKILSVRRSQIYAMVDPTASLVIRKFHIYATGQPVDAMAYTGEWNYIGSFSSYGPGKHIFEEV